LWVEVGFEGVEDFAGDVAFEGSDDVAFGVALGEFAVSVVDCWLVVFESADDDDVEGAVGLSVSAAVESHSVGFA
jgi:hypothetical protein